MKQDDIQQHFTSINKFLTDELAKIRTGRASASLVEDISVNAYQGSLAMPLKELASISVDGQSLLISPWDKSIIDAIEKEIADSGHGLNPINEGDAIRVNVPSLTEERRKEMVKEVSQVVEEAKIRVRNIRQNAIKAVEEQEENGVISEDDLHREKKRIEEAVGKANAELEEIGKAKKDELLNV